MAAYTLTIARTRCRTHHLDDDGTRWSDAETDEALKVALSTCMDDYLASGGRHWSTDTGDITATSSLYDISASNPLMIHGVARKHSTVYYPLKRMKQPDVRRVDTADLTLRIYFTPTFAFPTTVSNNLIGDSVSPPDYPAFDEWVCVRAAIVMSVKDDERLESLERLEMMLRDGIMQRLAATSSRRPSIRSVGWSKLLAWDYDPRDQEIQVGYQNAWGWF